MQRFMLVVVALAAIVLPTATATAETVLEPRTEQLNISAGCVGTGTCTSTRWLGKAAGDANSNWLTATTPVDEVLYRADGTVNWRDYPSDDSLPAAGYLLDASRPMEVTVTVRSVALTVNNTVHARITLFPKGKAPVLLAEQTQELLLVEPDSSDSVTFNFDLPEGLSRVPSITAEIAVHGVNAQGGYINQSGASTVKVPHLVEVAL